MTRVGKAFEFIKRARINCLLVMTLLCLLLGENYPFSNFPMYSSFGPRTYFLYLADASGTALPTKEFGLTSAVMKKMFDRYRQIEMKRASCSKGVCVEEAENLAGESILRGLERSPALRNREQKLRGLQVRYVTIQLAARDLVFDTRTVAAHK